MIKAKKTNAYHLYVDQIEALRTLADAKVDSSASDILREILTEALPPRLAAIKPAKPAKRQPATEGA